MIKIALLVPTSEEEIIQREYMKYLMNFEVRCFLLPFPTDKKKISVSMARNYITNHLASSLNGFDYIGVCDGEYFKAFYGSCKPATELGYIHDSKLGKWKILYIPSYKAIYYDPDRTRNGIKVALTNLVKHATGAYTKPGANIIYSESYPKTEKEIQEALDKLHIYDSLTCDIETYSLKHPEAGLGSICFCWNEHEGIAFKIDPDKDTRNEPVRKILKAFFIKYQGCLIFHNISFDAYILTYQLFMDSLLDTKGLREGLLYLLDNFEDTKLITYVATNNCTANHLSLKEQSIEFAGNYAQEDIGDITKIDEEQLLRYNLTDGLATWFVYNKWYAQMIADNQEDIYSNLLKPAIKDIIQMQLTGLPLDMNQVKKVKAQLESEQNKALYALMTSPIIINFEKYLNNKWVDRKNSEYKVKRVTLADAHESFNPNSNLQLRELFYDELGLPVLATTKSKEPSTSSDTIKALINYTDNPDIKVVLQALIDYSDVDKILTAFIPAFEKAYAAPDGWHYLFGNFNLGGTVSGRLSSSNP